MSSADFYHKVLFGLLFVTGALFATTTNPKDITPLEELTVFRQKGDDEKYKKKEKLASQWAFYVVYGLLVTAETLQGPFLYPLYRDTYGLSQPQITTLLATGFLTAASTTSFIPKISSYHSHLQTTLITLTLLLLSALTTSFTMSFPILLISRAVSGAAIAVGEYSLENWMVGDFDARFLAEKGLDLERTKGVMRGVAEAGRIGAGIVTEWMGGRAVLGASGLMVLAAIGVMKTQFDENHAPESEPESSPTPPLALALTITLFTTTDTLFLHLYPATLPPPPHSPPHGALFSCLLCTRTSATLLYSRAHELSLQTERPSLPPTGKDYDVDISKPGSHRRTTVVKDGKAALQDKLAALLLVVCAAAATLGVAALVARRGAAAERRMFWLFCAYQGLVGVFESVAEGLNGILVGATEKEKGKERRVWERVVKESFRAAGFVGVVWMGGLDGTAMVGGGALALAVAAGGMTVLTT